MKKIPKVLWYAAGIPFLVSLPGLVLSLGGLTWAGLALMPLLTAALYLLLHWRKKLDPAFAAKVSGGAALVLLVCFTALMVLASGNVEGVLVSRFSGLLVPFAPAMLVPMLTGQQMMFYLAAWGSYAAAFAVSAGLAGLRFKRLWGPLALTAVCTAVCFALYGSRPAVKYGGHGFAYMHGYSSTDFGDYMVYSDPSRLAVLDGAPSLTIEREEDMPVMDGAEACYPLYAAFAKAVYQDIDRIEESWMQKTEDLRWNGKIVTFTNSIWGFERLLTGAKDRQKFGGTVDLFFGARPSAEQLQYAEEDGVPLEITPIGREAFVFFVEADNPLSDVTADQLRAIYHGEITNWKELGGKDQPILAFQRPKNSGSQTMMEAFMGDVSLRQPQTYEMVDAMMGVVHKVAQYANERGALGYSFRYFVEELNQEKGVKLLSVDGVPPTLENIKNGSYPLAVDVCLITRRDDPNPYVRQMIDFALSEQGQELVQKTGYAPVAE